MSFLISVLFKLFLIHSYLSFIASQSLYTIIAPGTIKSNRNYTVCATLHNTVGPANFTIGLRNNASWYTVQSLELQPHESKLVIFHPNKLEFHKIYELFVEGSDGLQFFKSRKLLVGEKEGVNIYIETDRGIYKPGDLLRFRIILLNEYGRPTQIVEPIKVQIFDGSRNRVKQFKDVNFKHGVYRNELQLSKEPVLGTWCIKVVVGGRFAQEKQAEFDVNKYVLPKFFVKIESDKNIVLNDRLLKINVFGRYTHNHPVEGTVSLKIKQKLTYGYLTDLADFVSNTSVTEEFKASFVVDLNHFIGEIFSNHLRVIATLKEKQTGIVESAMEDITIQHNAYKMNLLHDETEIRNGKPYCIKVKIEHWNNTSINDTSSVVSLRYENITLESKLNENGVAAFKWEFKALHYVFVRYKNSSESRFLIPDLYDSYNYEGRRMCVLQLENMRPQLNSVIDVTVKSNDEIKYFEYILISHGNIIKSKIVHLPPNQKSHTFQLLTGMEMVPVSFLYVQYIYEDKLIYCEMKIELPEKFENQLSLSTPKIKKPGENITMTIYAQPGSQVAITAVDLSSNILKKGNKITKSEIMNDMREDTSYSIGFDIYPGVYSGLTILTDIEFKTFGIAKGTSIPGEDIKEVDDVRSFFPETWIFEDVNITREETTINFTLPDTITTWVVSAFSLNDNIGIGILDSGVEILSLKPFFISASLPYNVKTGEIVSVLVVVSNYYNESLNTEVTMENMYNEFQFVNNSTHLLMSSAVESRHIAIQKNSVESVNFLIKTHKIGSIDIKIQAKNKLASDKVLQKLLVEGGDIKTSHNQELYINLNKDQNFTTWLKPIIPQEVELESLLFSVSGDILLPSLENLDNLVDMPTGCGEQNMVHFAPNILVLEYLSTTGQSSKYKKLVAKAQKFAEIGFQNQLNFRHRNGGYSVFGPIRDEVPSNWLTAYVARFFIKSMKYVSIETRLIESSLKFLAETQMSSGEFPNAGYLIRMSYLNRYSFTAFVVMSFLENEKYAKKYRVTIQKALRFLSSNIDEVLEVHSLAIMSVVFQRVKHEKAPEIIDRLKLLIKNKNNLQWWQEERDSSSAVEITSYALLALLHTPGHYLPIAKWLMEQRNSHGGFKSSQDTVVGLQALINFSQLSVVQNNSMITIFYKALDESNEDLEKGSFNLDHDNRKVLQHCELPPTTRSLYIEVSGVGSTFLQFSYNYQKVSSSEMRSTGNLTELSALNNSHKLFVIKNKAELTAKKLTLNLEICIQYKSSEDEHYLKTNMIITEVNLPSGFIAREENIEELKSSEDVDRIENEKTSKIVFYFTYTTAEEEKCIELVADKKYQVENLKPSTILVYEYYQPDRRDFVTYEL